MQCKTLFDVPQSELSVLDRGIFSGHNYLDLITQKNSSKDYKILLGPDPLLASLFFSPDGTRHLYGSDPVKAVELLSDAKIPTSGEALFTTAEIFQQLKNSGHNLVQTFEYDYFLRPRDADFSYTKSELVDIQQVGTSEKDQRLVDQWYNEFREEMGATWATPDVTSVSGSLFVMRNQSNEPIGFYAKTLESNSRYWFGRFLIGKAYRGKGYGQMLMNFLLEQARLKGASPALLVEGDNLAAVQLYKSLGFQKVATIVVGKYN